jgi:glycosyltransferase A (GT-A) superfamily protein (DUF2064 family)
VDLIVLAKEPVPGRVKTRLCPPCTPETAAALARAALADTLAAGSAAGPDRLLLALDGRPGLWCPPGVEVVSQGSGRLADRLAHAWTHVAGPALLVGMDTPQVTADELTAAMAWLETPGTTGRPGRPRTPGPDAVFGPATDGGWWALGLRRPQPHVFAGIPTSRPDTGRLQLDRLHALGLRVHVLSTRTDVDEWPDALAVAAEAPITFFAAAVRRQMAALELSG